LEGDVVVAILIVDDNPVNAKLLVLTLRGAGFQSKVAGNGREALAILSDTPEIQLIITDYMMLTAQMSSEPNVAGGQAAA
jgi:CheY-like chemotaxis protein